MAEQYLNRADVGPRFEKVDSKRVAERMGYGFRNPARGTSDIRARRRFG